MTKENAATRSCQIFIVIWNNCDEMQLINLAWLQHSYAGKKRKCHHTLFLPGISVCEDHEVGDTHTLTLDLCNCVALYVSLEFLRSFQEFLRSFSKFEEFEEF